MNRYRCFFTLHRLSKSEEEKLLKWSKQGGDKPDIKYRKLPKEEIVEALSVPSASGKITDREYESTDIRDSSGMFRIARKFATVYAVVEYREGEKLGSLEEFFVAEDQDLIPK